MGNIEPCPVENCHECPKFVAYGIYVDGRMREYYEMCQLDHFKPMKKVFY